MAVIGQINGVSAITDMLKALPGKVQQDNVLALALKKGAVVIRDQAEANLEANGSVETGLLAHTMVIMQKPEQLYGLIEVALYPSKHFSMVVRQSSWSKQAKGARPSKYAHFIEGGFAHKTEYGTETIAAKPFMRPAFDNKSGEAVRVIQAEVEAGVAAAAQKLGFPVK